MKSIAIVTYGMKKGGAERVISLLANYLVDKGIEVNIYTLTDSKCEYTLSPQVNIISLNSEIFNRKSVFKIINQMKRLRKIIKHSQPDVTLVLPEEVSAIVVPSLLGLNTSIVVSERNNPWIMPQNKVKRLLRFLFYRYADGYIFQTNQSKKYFNKGIQKKSIVIPNPISEDIINFRTENINKNEIISVGRLEPQKNFMLLIEAFNKFHKKNPNYKLTIYGEGAMRQTLEDKIVNLGLNEVVSLPGKKDNIFQYMSQASLFIMSSDFEGMPNALMEAMALGLPVISTDCPSGGPSELINDNINGILVPTKDVNALVSAMERVMASNELRINLSNNAIKLYDNLHPNLVLKTWHEYLKSIVNN